MKIMKLTCDERRLTDVPGGRMNGLSARRDLVEAVHLPARYVGHSGQLAAGRRCRRPVTLVVPAAGPS